MKYLLHHLSGSSLLGLLILIGMGVSSASLKSQTLFINEMMSSNAGFLFDEDGDNPDWIELYNPTDGILNLSGYFLSDKVDQLELWALPDTTIGSGEFLVIFASGKDRQQPGEELHTNFSIKSDGEDLFLTRQGMVMHHMPAVALLSNSSYGMQPDGEYPFVIFGTPTPGLTNNLGSPAAAVEVNIPGGIYPHPFEIELFSTLSGTRIFYTLDGNTPTANSLLYDHALMLSKALYSQANISQIQVTYDELHNSPDPIHVLRAITIRAAAFDSLNQMVSPVETNTYFIETLGNNHHGLPVISICAEHDDLFDYHTGIYVPGVHWDPDEPAWTGNYHMRGDAWEKTISLEYYSSESTGFKQNAGLRIHGGQTRRWPQKPLRLYARSEYGESTFDYALFGQQGLQEYKRLVLKPFSASWSHNGVEDHLCNNMIQKLRTDGILSKPVALYLNGEYWGIYFLQERIDERLIGAKYNLDPDSIDLITNWYGVIQAGSNKDFLDLYDFVDQHDFSMPHYYDSLAQRIDLANYIDYMIFQIFSANFDWPANNMKCWRAHRPGAKWRWIFFDGDAALDGVKFDAFHHNTYTGSEFWPTNARSTLFFRKLMENELFRTRFFLRMEYVLNHVISDNSNRQILDQTIDQIHHDINHQILRFNLPENYQRWADQIMNCRHFLGERKCVLAKQTQKQYEYQLHVAACTPEEVSLIDVLVYPNPHQGQFGLSLISSAAVKATITITNIAGQQLYHHETMLLDGMNSFRINDPTLPDGILIISVITESTVATYKMLCRRSQ
jgi:hypothetical protein